MRNSLNSHWDRVRFLTNTSQTSRILATTGGANGRSQISSLLFDAQQDLLWCGDSSGYTGSFTSANLTPYTRFRTSLSQFEPVEQLLNHQRGILSLLHSNINFNSRTGGFRLALNANLMTSAQDAARFNGLLCMSLNNNSNNDMVIGGTRSLFKVDLLKPNVVAQAYNHSGGASFIKTSLKLLVLGKSNGALETFDPLSNQVVKTFNGHNGLLSDLDVLGNYAATCGYSVRPLRRTNNGLNGAMGNSNYLVDPLVNIYDLRMMRPLSPIPFPAGASFVRFHPKLPNIIIVASTTGQIQFVDIYDNLNVTVYQGDVSSGPLNSMVGVGNGYLSNLNMSPNGEYMSFSDSELNLHLWSYANNDTQSFTNFPNPIEQPDLDLMMMQNLPRVSIDDESYPLSSVGLPYYKDFLLSNYPNDMRFVKEQLKLPKPPDDELINTHDQIAAASAPQDRFGFMVYDRARFGRRYLENNYEALKEKQLKHKNGKKTLLPKFISERKSTDRMSDLMKTLSNTSVDSDWGTMSTSNATTGGASALSTKQAFQATPLSSSGNASGDDSVFQLKLSQFNDVPNCYTKLQIQYSRFGVDDFDFDYYNQTKTLCGLENHLDNSYINPLLQLYRYSLIFYNEIVSLLFIEWLPNDLETITTKHNAQGTSTLNELGYLFDMMYKAQSKNTTIANFSECLNSSPEAASLDVLNFDECRTLNLTELQLLIVRFNKFFAQSLSQDERLQRKIGFNETTGIDSILGCLVASETKSNGCGYYDRVTHYQYSIDLNTIPHQRNAAPYSMEGSHFTSSPKRIILGKNNNNNIVSYLEKSLYQNKTLRCQQCSNSRYHLLEIKQEVLKLPPLLVINLNLTAQIMESVNFRNWLANEFYTTDRSKSGSGGPVKISTRQSALNSTRYELLGYVCEISHGPETSPGAHNLIAYIKIDGSWYLFNDFLIMGVPENEVFDLTKTWKKPTIVFYQETPRDKLSMIPFHYINGHLNNKIDLSRSVIYKDHFAGVIRQDYQKQYRLLTKDEKIPQPGSLVAIDAEFVTIEPEEVEINSTGVRKVIKPSKLSLARISVLRGEPDTNGVVGVPFIDDYIVHTKKIKDYLTSFSGIEPGDLDPIHSKKNLVTLQTAYRRLWLLLNMGCIFVGHGLYNDFRCINLQVPKLQIRDTGEFYYLPEFKRKLSLKFLAYVLLKEKVQTGNHDSIEDAHTALLLYRKYLDLQLQGDFESTLYNIYFEGQQLRFRVPES